MVDQLEDWGFSTNAKYGKSFFFDDENDFDIYVEDTGFGYKKIYLLLLRRIYEKLKITQIFPLGNRDEVIKRARSHSSERKSIFICDGDLYLLSKPDEDLPAGLVRLDRYCIENYLFDCDALLSILEELDPDRERHEIENLIRHQDWISSFADEMKNLFITFGCAHAINKDIKTISHCKETTIAPNPEGDICTKALESIKTKVTAEINSHDGLSNLNELMELFKETKPDDFVRKYVSAKDYLLPFITRRARCILKIKVDQQHIKQMLANKCNINDLRNILLQGNS